MIGMATLAHPASRQDERPPRDWLYFRLPDQPLPQASDRLHFSPAMSSFSRPVLIALTLMAAVCGARAQSSYTVTTLHKFSGTDGSYPVSALIQGTDGNFYGTTEFGGNPRTNAGTIFRLTPAGEFTTLHEFIGDKGVDGANPDTPLIEFNGNLYGATAKGAYGSKSGYGTVFRMGLDGTFITVGNFEAASPNPVSLVLTSDGMFNDTIIFFGTTAANGGGTFFRFIATQGVAGIIHTFHYTPGPVILGKRGSVFGTVMGGGANGAGSAFEVNNVKLNGIHSFDAGDVQPRLQCQTGTGLYGIIGMVPSQPSGSIFRVTQTGEYSIVHMFTFPNAGSIPAVLIAAQNGNLYGTAGEVENGSPNQSDYQIYELTPQGLLTTLRHFVNARVPASLLQGSDGNLYCTDVNVGDGSIFRLNLTP
jgi:uncharacterized repeat protein (TIGR03803 family)